MKDFQSGVKGADRPAQAKDRAAVIKAYEATAPLLADFLASKALKTMKCRNARRRH